MKKIYVSILSLAWANVLFSQTVPDLHHYEVKKTSETIVVDGELSETSWGNVPFTESFVAMNGSVGKLDNKAKLLWSETHLYLAFVIQDTSIYSNLSAKDAALWNQDVVEILIDQDGDGLNYCEMGFSPNDGNYDLSMLFPYGQGSGYPADVNWDITGLMSAVKISGNINVHKGATQWVCEIAIPFSGIPANPVAIAVPKVGEEWRLNMVRVDHDFENSAEQLYTWNYTNGSSNHVPERFGYVKFSETDAANGINDVKVNKELNVQNFPNPFSGSTTFIIKSKFTGQGNIIIFDLSGQIVKQDFFYIQSGQNTINWNANGLSQGSYVYLLKLDNQQTNGTLIIL